MNTRLSMGIVRLFICFYKLVFRSKFPGLPFLAEICPLLQENAIKQCSVFFLNCGKLKRLHAVCEVSILRVYIHILRGEKKPKKISII